MNIQHCQMHFNRQSQAGFSLMEAVVAMSISLVVTASMVALMANSLATTSRIVNMTKLTDDMRSTMQMLTRDVRRTSYNADAMFCYANQDCFTDGSVTLPGDIVINNSDNCFIFQLDRGNDDGLSTDYDAGAFRLMPVGNPAVGVIEMWVGIDPPDCGDARAPTIGCWLPIRPAWTSPTSMSIPACLIPKKSSTMGRATSFPRRCASCDLPLMAVWWWITPSPGGWKISSACATICCCSPDTYHQFCTGKGKK